MSSELWVCCWIRPDWQLNQNHAYTVCFSLNTGWVVLFKFGCDVTLSEGRCCWSVAVIMDWLGVLLRCLSRYV